MLCWVSTLCSCQALDRCACSQELLAGMFLAGARGSSTALQLCRQAGSCATCIDSLLFVLQVELSFFVPLIMGEQQCVLSAAVTVAFPSQLQLCFSL